MIDSRRCLKLYFTCTYFHQNHLYKGALFEEDGNIYHIAPGSTTPALMYDFSSEPGTTIKVGSAMSWKSQKGNSPHIVANT